MRAPARRVTPDRVISLLMTYTRAERVVGPTPCVIKHEEYRYVCGSCS
jgi:hypothetical protein